ncbi:hypothetical protein Poly24_36720 [Rosistilla carotiformis]|uniref:Aldo/keto reductase n=1 Tax=Rosistilla carotiformis TaxID=2528017 RepID=A0A518JWN5_9BACT|nr:hypothetical protein [Rosistilla carotiformis]QDV69954.1 hypothetical protein Poly24_36720 [Rosistilla carotiformis]
MKNRKLGNGRLEVSALGLGCMGMSFGFGQASVEGKDIALIRSAVDRCVNGFRSHRKILRPNVERGDGI